MQNSIREVASIVQAVSQAESPEDQVNIIVDSISKLMFVDVCSLYLLNEKNEMELLASKGLAAVAIRKLIIPAGKGLVGLVASSRHPINIADAEKHSAYYYVAEAEEDRFYGFCAVPLVGQGNVLGVLVVQSTKKRKFTQDEESFLVTLAAQLALLFVNYPKHSVGKINTARIIHGVKGAPGVGIGRCYMISTNELENIVDKPCENTQAAIEEWRHLVEVVQAQLASEQQAFSAQVASHISNLFSAYQKILADTSYAGYVEECIQAGNWVPGAIRMATQHFSDIFLQMEDEYIRSRHEDIYLIGNKLLLMWNGLYKENIAITEDIILVGNQIGISDMASIPPQYLKGIISANGSALSHIAVLSNAMGIPAVLGVTNINFFVAGEQIVIDGEQARIHIRPSELILNEYQALISANQQFEQELKKFYQEPAITLDGQVIELYTNTGLLADISPGLLRGAQGVGLYRTEIPFMLHDSFPTEDEQIIVYQQVLKVYQGKPVYMRTLDIGGDKQLPYFPITNEENPALGWRGIRFSLDNSQLLMTQIRAMLRASENLNNLNILLPMVTSCIEVDMFIDLLNDALIQLKSEGFSIKKPPIGITIEVPAAISQIAFWAGKIDFLSIGSNDLSQYLLAIDRNNAKVATKYDHVHPAVIHEIKRIIRNAKLTDLPVSLCGEMATDPIAVILLIGMGLKTLSMSAVKLPYIKWLIRSVSLADAQRIANNAMLLDSPEKIRQLVREELGRLNLSDMLKQIKSFC